MGSAFYTSPRLRGEGAQLHCGCIESRFVTPANEKLNTAAFHGATITSKVARIGGAEEAWRRFW
jgi:hypothetical protein